MEEAPQRSSKLAHIAMLLTPGAGHLIPLLELARKLINLQTLTITFIIPHQDANRTQNALLEETFSSTSSILLPPPPLVDDDGFPDDIGSGARIAVGIIRSTPHLTKFLTELNESSYLSAFVADLFGSFAFGQVKELGIPIYLFYPSNAMVLSFILSFPELDRSCTCEHFKDLPDPVVMPGCVPVHGSDLLEPVPDYDRKSFEYEGFLKMCKNFMLADGILVNSFLELEPDTFKALSISSGTCPLVYHVGPLIRSCPNRDISHECLKWLDEQPAKSVLFVSFGSGGTLSRKQLTELVSGLEMSGRQRFLLVAKNPNNKARDAAYLGNDDDADDKMDSLLCDFIARTRERGLVLSKWAPQIEILSHVAVGGFLTHCGWNSTLESIVHGVPLIAWPFYAEQKMNAVLVSEGLKVAFRVRESEDGFVEREEISRAVRRLMVEEEGEELRKRMGSLKDAAGKAFTADGSSSKSIVDVARKWIGEKFDIL